MTIALATRGYLAPPATVQVVMGDGPRITGVKEETPQITGAAPAGPSAIEPPSIVASKENP